MTESQIVRQILDYLAAERIFAFRLNTSAFSGEHKGKQRFFRSHSLGSGTADIFALTSDADDASGTNLRWFTPLWIECKTATGKQSAEQKNFQEYVESLGHRYILARSSEDVRIACAAGAQ